MIKILVPLKSKISIFLILLFSSLSIILFFPFHIISQSSLFPDSDGDGITDKLELFAGLNPNEDECQPRKCRGISVQGSIDGEYLILIMGQNLSMQEKFSDESSKLDSLKSVFKDNIQYSPNYIKIGLYSYGKNGCSSLDEIHSPFKQNGKSNILKELEVQQPSGKNSVASTLEKLRDDLKDKKGKFNILVILDSLDSCNGNLKEAIRNLNSLNNFRTGIRLYFVGMMLDKLQSEELEKITNSTTSKFINVNSLAELKRIFDAPFREVINSLKGIVCLQVELDDLIKCESNKINQLRRLSSKKLTNPINKNFSPEEKDYFLQQIPVVESNSKLKLETYDLYKRDTSMTYQKRIIEISKIITIDNR